MTIPQISTVICLFWHWFCWVTFIHCVWARFFGEPCTPHPSEAPPRGGGGALGAWTYPGPKIFSARFLRRWAWAIEDETAFACQNFLADHMYKVSRMRGPRCRGQGQGQRERAKVALSRHPQPKAPPSPVCQGKQSTPCASNSEDRATRPMRVGDMDPAQVAVDMNSSGSEPGFFF